MRLACTITHIKLDDEVGGGWACSSLVIFFERECNFYGSPVVKMLHLHCQGHGFSPGQGAKHGPKKNRHEFWILVLVCYSLALGPVP